MRTVWKVPWKGVLVAGGVYSRGAVKHPLPSGLRDGKKCINGGKSDDFTETSGKWNENPQTGACTWCIDNDKAAQTVRTAVTLGYRLIDTAQAYENEQGVGGESLQRFEELFVASKVAAELKTLQPPLLETLWKNGAGLSGPECIHAPQPWNEFRDTKRYFCREHVWRALEDAQAAGKVQVIGVSNFQQDDLENLLSDCRIQPMVNQILLHRSAEFQSSTFRWRPIRPLPTARRT